MSEVITFYSYKGGVGRTMALANVSVVLAKWGHKVLVVDWDLEAPGLEHFYKDYIDDIKRVEARFGVIDLLQLEDKHKWQDDIIEISVPQSDVPIHLITSGRRDENYFKKVRSFDVETFYEKNGGDVIEKLRNEWLANYDYVLIDSRTGITEIGGICTIQLPDTVVMLFTATSQGFDGVLDIIKRASAAQQKLSYDRQKLIFLPIPSKFETNTEFKLSQEWLEIFAEKLDGAYNDWLPSVVNKKDFLELTKIPYIAYFSFGEKLPVIEQGVKDPSGLGYAYETLAALIANHLSNVDMLFNLRDQYIRKENKNNSIDFEKTNSKPVKSTQNIFISYSADDYDVATELKQHFANLESQNKISVFLDKDMEYGFNWYEEMEIQLMNADIVLCVISPSYMSSTRIMSEQFQLLLDKKNKAHVIPIYSTITDIEGSFFDQLHGMPNTEKFPKPGGNAYIDNGIIWLKTISKSKRNLYYSIIIKEIKKII